MTTHTVMQAFSYNQIADRLDVTVWIEKGNLVFNPGTPTMGSCTVKFYDKDGVLQFTMVDSTPDAQGIYTSSQVAPGLSSDTLYYAVSEVVVASVAGGKVSGAKGMFTL